MYARFKIFSLLLVLFLAGCSFFPNDLKTAERLIETAPDSALQILRNIQKDHVLTDADRALYGLLLFQALDKNELTLQPDSVINFSISYYDKKNDDNKLAICYFYKARMFKYAQKYEEATKFYLSTLDLSKNGKNYDLLGKVFSDIGEISATQGDNVTAREKFKLAVINFNKINKPIPAGYRTIDIGRTYRNEKNYKTAHKYFTSVLKNSNDSMLDGAAYQEIGVNFWFNKKLDSAQIYLHKSLCYPYKGNDYSIRNFALADLFYSKGQYDSAVIYADKALKYPASFFTQRECYRILANTCYINGDYKRMAEYMTKFQSCSDSVRLIETQTKSAVIENIYQTSVSEGKTRRWLLITGSFLPVIILFGFLIYMRLRKKSIVHETKIVQQVEQLESYGEKLHQKQGLLKTGLVQKIEDARTLQMPKYKKSTLAQREEIDKEIYNACLHVNNWKAFSDLMNDTFNGIIITLENNFPDVGRKEIIWCCLHLLEIPSTDIALILEYQQVSLYKLKQRLAQKMNFTSTKELDQYLKEISETK